MKRERIKKKSAKRGKKPEVILLITLKCFITVSVGIVRVFRCHQQNMTINIINYSEVSRLSVVIHTNKYVSHEERPHTPANMIQPQS